MKKLDLPAANLQCALQAYKGGADCVHLTGSLPLDDLRKLKYFCQANNKQFYSEGNTISSWIKEYITPDAVDSDDVMYISGAGDNPQLCYWTARYNRLILNGADGTDAQASWALQSMTLAGSGIVAGTIIRTIGNKAVVRFSQPVALRDMLGATIGSKTVKFPLTSIDPAMSFIPQGRTVTINFPTDSFDTKPQSGTQIIHYGAGSFPLEDEEIKLYRKPVDLNVSIKNTGIEINNTLFSCPVQKADRPKDLQPLFEDVFSRSDKSLFTLARLFLVNESSFENPFAPLSELKKIRKNLYTTMDEDFLLHS